MDCSGLIHVYCGDGKGKTTAAIGLIIRALGHKKSVILVQLMKSHETGELAILKKLENIQILRGKDGSGFSFSMTEEQKENTRKIGNANLLIALQALKNGECDMLVIDEAGGALSKNMVDENIFHEILKYKPEQTELVFTGRNIPEFLINRADYITEMKMVKHPFTSGIAAREGIEF